MPHIGGDEFRAAWFALREAMRHGAEDVQEIRLTRDGEHVRLFLALTPPASLESDQHSIGAVTVSN